MIMRGARRATKFIRRYELFAAAIGAMIGVLMMLTFAQGYLPHVAWDVCIGLLVGGIIVWHAVAFIAGILEPLGEVVCVVLKLAVIALVVAPILAMAMGIAALFA